MAASSEKMDQAEAVSAVFGRRARDLVESGQIRCHLSVCSRPPGHPDLRTAEAPGPSGSRASSCVGGEASRVGARRWTRRSRHGCACGCGRWEQRLPGYDRRASWVRPPSCWLSPPRRRSATPGGRSVTVLRWAFLVLWLSLAVMATGTLVWLWNSKERSETLERSFQPLYDLWRIRARTVGAASLTMLWSSVLTTPLEVVSLLRGGAVAQGGFSQLADDLSLLGVYGFFLFGILALTTNLWGRPRWIIPPYLRPVRRRDGLAAPRGPGGSAE